MAPPKTKNPPDEDLPVLTSYTMTKTARGWVVVSLTTQGKEVTDSEILTDGAVSKAAAEDVLRVTIARRFFYVEG